MYGTKLAPPANDADKKVRRWARNLQRGIDKREPEEKVWKPCEDFAEGKHFNGREAAGEQVAVNKIAAFIRSRQAATLYNNPRAALRPSKPEDWRPRTINVLDTSTGEMSQRNVPKYRVKENLLNFVLGQPAFELNHTLRLCNKSALTHGIAVAMCGFWATFETPPKPQGVEELDVDPDTGLPDVSNLATDRNGQPILDDDGLPIEAVKPTSEMWFVDYVPLRRMIFDPDGGNCFSTHRWVAMEMVLPLSKVKKDPLYRHTRDLKPSGRYTDKGEMAAYTPQDGRFANDIDKDDELIRLFFIWDIENRRFMVMADGHGKFLRDEDTPEDVDDHPFVFLRLDDRISSGSGTSGGEWYCRPLLADLVPLNSFFDELATQYLNAARRNARKTIGVKGALSPEEKKQLTGPDDNIHIEVDLKAGGFASLEEVVHPWPQLPVSVDVLQGLNLTDKMFYEVAGQPPDRGVTQVETATQGKIMDDRASLNENDHRKLLAEFIRGIFKKVNDSIDANMTLPIAVAIQGADGKLHQQMTHREDIVGDFDVTVDIQEMMPQNQMAEWAQITNILQTYAQFNGMFTDPVVAEWIISTTGNRNSALVDALVRQSQALMAMQQPPPLAGGQPPPGQIGPGEGAEPPMDTAQLLAQHGGKLGPLMGG